MPLGTPAPLYKRKKISKIITDLSHVAQDEYESEPEASELDLGKKIQTPKDIMLEELSLMKNKGSKMFKMRKQRMERFIYENNPDIFSSESMDNLEMFVPSLGGQIGGQMINVGGHFLSKETGHVYYGGMRIGGGGPPVPPPKPGSKAAGAKGTRGAGGAGGVGEKEGQGGGKHGKGGKEGREGERAPLKGSGCDDAKEHSQVNIYVSPWEKAMKGDQKLIATLKVLMPGPMKQQDFPNWKCFNRCALPYGGFENADQFLKFQLPEVEATKKEVESIVVFQHNVNCRPSFNRTPIGWVGSSEPGSIHMETNAVPFDGETDEL